MIFLTVDKAEKMAPLAKLLQLKQSLRIDLPERLDRKRILEALLPAKVTAAIDMLEVAKYLQGKTYGDLELIVRKIKRQFRAQFDEVCSRQASPTQSELIEALLRLEKDRKVFGEKSVRIPEVKWADVGGLAGAKEDII